MKASAGALIDIGETFEMDPISISRLKSLGLIDFTLGSGMRIGREIACVPSEMFQVNMTSYIVIGDGNATMTLFDYPFTEHGLQLARLMKLGSAEGFADSLVEYWKSLGFKVGIVAEYLGDNRVKYQMI